MPLDLEQEFQGKLRESLSAVAQKAASYLCQELSLGVRELGNEGLSTRLESLTDQVKAIKAVGFPVVISAIYTSARRQN